MWYLIAGNNFEETKLNVVNLTQFYKRYISFILLSSKIIKAY